MTQHETGSCHAEALCISWLLNNRVKKHTKIQLIVYRLKKDGTCGMAKPCYHCVKLLKRAVNVYNLNIKKVTYSLDNGTFESVSVDTLSNDYITSGSKKLLRVRKK